MLPDVGTPHDGTGLPDIPLNHDGVQNTDIPQQDGGGGGDADMLPPATFHILLALAGEDLHGYAIIQEVARRTGGDLKLSAGTLYRSIQRMLEPAAKNR